VVPGSLAFELFTQRIREMLLRAGSGLAPEGAAMAQAYGMMIRQASMLSYKNAFTIMSLIVVCLSPLPFLMRLAPRRGPKPPDEAMAGH
jgi:DHA2 family multidrug resistance protein